MRLLDKPPPLPPFQPGAFTSTLRSERVATRLGTPLAACVLICFLTGLYSHYQQDPDSVLWTHIPSGPSWLYQLSQGLHVATGIAAIPLLLLKLWTVYPRLFAWPPVRTIFAALERVLIAVLVACMIFQLVTGLLNTTQWYPWQFPFRQTHWAIAFVIVGAILFHLAFKMPAIIRALRAPADPPATGPDPLPGDAADAADAAADSEREPSGSISRRGLLITAGAGAAAATVVTVGQTFAPLQDVALLAPRKPDIGPQGLPVNKTFENAGIDPAAVGPDYRMVIAGPREQTFTLEQLQDLPQAECELPIACVEGWSASTLWGGVQLAALLDLAGIDPDATIKLTSLDPYGPYGVGILQPQFARDPLTLIALRIRGEELALDHGYPARLITPNRPGVLQTKWLTRIEAV